MKIDEHGMLVSIDVEDISKAGELTLPDNVKTVKPGAFYGHPSLKKVTADAKTIIHVRAFSDPNDSDTRSFIKAGANQTAINLLWLNRKTDHSQRLIFKEKWTKEDCSEYVALPRKQENYGELLNSAIKWHECNPDSDIRIWYDSEVTTETQVSNTENEIKKALGEAADKVQLKDIRTISVVLENPDIFSDKTGFFFKIDLLKLIITHHSLGFEDYDYTIYADIGVEPLTPEQLLNDTNANLLDTHGILGNKEENQFIQAKHNQAVIKSLALIINANLQRCYQGLQYENYQIRNVILSRLFDAVYYDTTHTLHFLAYGFQHGKILINEQDDRNELENWVEYNPATHGVLPFGNYARRYGTHFNFLKIPFIYDSFDSFTQDFYDDGVASRDVFKFVGLGKMTAFGTEKWSTESEMTLADCVKNIYLHRGCRYDIKVPGGRDHIDPIAKTFTPPRPQLATLNYDSPETCFANPEVFPVKLGQKDSDNHSICNFGSWPFSFLSSLVKKTPLLALSIMIGIGAGIGSTLLTGGNIGMGFVIGAAASVATYAALEVGISLLNQYIPKAIKETPTLCSF